MGLSRDNAILNMMYRGMTTIADFNWDAMTTVPIYCLLTPQDVDNIRQLILSPRYSGNNKFKMEKIDEIMHYRGFKRFAGGTNRLVYTHLAAPNAVFKVAIDSVGINDNPAEFRNQNFLKPYCCKVFECSPCGTIASFEKVERITTFDEFYSIGEDYFQIIVNVILGKYVMDDIGIDFFMNFGIRAGCFPVILDFPYLFELDGRKLECNNVLDDGSICHGEIDYDAGFNKLVCKKCGRHFKARDLAKPPKEGGILLRKKGGRRMKLVITDLDGNVIETHDTTIERDHLSRHDPDVKTSKRVQVVIESVPSAESEEKNVMAGHETKKTPKVVVNNDQTVDANPTKNYRTRERRTVVNIIPGNAAKNRAAENPAPNHVAKVVIETTKPKTTVKAPETAPKYTEAPKTVVEHKVEIEEPNTPVVGRVINVSVGKKSNKSDIVTKVSNDHVVKVDVETTTPESKVEPPKVVIEEVKAEPVIEEMEPEIVNITLDSKKYETKPTSEEKVEVSDDSKAVAEEYQKIVEGNAPAMQQAVFFGDEPGGITEEDVKKQEPEVEEVVEETEPVVENEELSDDHDEGIGDSQTEDEEVEAESTEASDTVVPIGTPLYVKGYIEIDNYCDTEYDHKYINEYYNKYLNEAPTVGDLVYVKHADTDGNDENSSESYYMYICIEESATDKTGLWKLIESDHDEIPVPVEGFTKVEISDADEEIEEPEASDETIITENESSEEESSEDETEDDEEEDYDDIVVSDHKPTIDEIEDGTFWCVPRHSKVTPEDIDSIMSSQDSTIIDHDLFVTYYKVDDEVVPITYDESECWVVDDDENKFHDLNDVIGSDGCVFEFCDELPDIDDAEPGKHYLLRQIEATHFDDFKIKPDKSKYRFICHAIDTYNGEEAPAEVETPKEEPKQEEVKAEVKTDEADVEDLIKAMKASSKKINPDDFLTNG